LSYVISSQGKKILATSWRKTKGQRDGWPFVAAPIGALAKGGGFRTFPNRHHHPLV
jgi:hypothetical protein